MRQINFNISGPTPVLAGSLAYVDLQLDNDHPTVHYSGAIEEDGRLIVRLTDDVPNGGGSFSVILPGCQQWPAPGQTQRVVIPVAGGSYEGSSIGIPVISCQAGNNPFKSGLGPVPSRAQVCGMNLTFQGLTVNLPSGPIPWFELGFQCQDLAGREAVYEAKHLAGDTHLIIEFFTQTESVYNEPGQPFEGMISPSGEQNPEWFRGLVIEILQNGFIPVVVFDGDNGDTPSDGYPNALRQLPILASLLRDLADRILFARFWDGVFYGSSPQNIASFGEQFRSILPNGYLAIEHNPGHIPVGNGPGDYELTGMMSSYDVIVTEFDENLSQDSTWQVAARLLGPRYHRPSDQPAGDDPSPPFYLAPGNTRGGYFTCGMEWVGEYLWVRGQTTLETVESQRAYLRMMGYEYLG